jgi:hypothetical protein
MTTESPLKDKMILAVDDEPDVLETLAELLDMCQVITKTRYGCVLKKKFPPSC